MSVASDLREAWSVAAAKPTGAGLRAIHFGGGGSRIWATVNDKNCPGLLISALNEESLASTIAAVASASGAMLAEIYHFAADGRNERGLHLWCTQADLLEAFSGFCEPFVQRLLAGESIQESFTACFDEFRRLMAGITQATIPAPIIGLLGELIVLSELVSEHPGAVKCWAYPELERHDFRSNLAAIEVKTSLRSQQSAPVVRISALDQLEPPEGGVLYLLWLRLERDPKGPVSIGRLVERVAGSLLPAPAQEFRVRVLADEEVRKSSQLSFTIQERRSFRVQAEFPRLVPSRLISGAPDAGVEKVTYNLDLSVAGAFACSLDEAKQALIKGSGAQ